jgi:hypothetical protein
MNLSLAYSKKLSLGSHINNLLNPYLYFQEVDQ